MKNGILTFGLLGAQVKGSSRFFLQTPYTSTILYNLLMLGSFVLQSSLVTEYQDSVF